MAVKGSRRTSRRRRGTQVAALAALALTVALAPPPSGAAAKTVWVCKPGAKLNPCVGSLRTTVVSPSGATRVVNPRRARKPRIDCFYVYPTVSEQPGPNADKSIDPEIRAIARYQAGRFSQRCRVFAPVYRQLTLAAIGGEVPAAAAQLAYSDVLEAWRTYLRRFNRGRGVVLIGHSQGTGMLRHLIRRQIDRRPKVRRRLVSAILLGGNVVVRKGRPAGGDFKNIRACRARRQHGCVIAFSAFNQTPPDDAVFGNAENRFAEAFDLPAGPQFRVLCTNPASLKGGTAPLRTLLPTAPFPGLIGGAIAFMYGGPPPTAPTPWIQPGDRYRGRCVRANGANVLMISPIGSAQHLNPSPDASWGLHLADGNIALGNLVSVLAAQAKAFARKRRRR